MVRTMYDSTNGFDIPVGAQMVAGYVDGRYRWTQSMWDNHPNAVHVRIAVFADTNDGHVLDVEPGNATPEQSPGWVVMRRTGGTEPSVYCNAATLPEVRRQFNAQGVPEPHYWIADWDGVAALDPGMVAKQYADDKMLGEHFDLSVVADFWPGVDSGPIPPAPAPEPPASWGTYVVVPGDTLSGIAERFGTTWQELQRINGIPNPDLIHPGDVIRLPGAPGVDRGRYQIQPGDTLSELAERWGTTVADIARVNNIPNPDYIVAGHWLVIP